MLHVTQPAIRQLKALIREHPEDPVVRISVQDVPEDRVAFRITLESAPQPEDTLQDCEGLVLAIEAQSASRLDGVTLDYLEHGGFKFLHPQPPDVTKLRLINLN